jgi:hypothetical protein
MKRLLVSLLALIYLVAGAGMSIRQHYCMGKMIGAAIDHPAHDGNHKCDRCGMVKKSNDNGCCKDEVKTFKSSDDQVLVKAISLPQHAWIAVLPKPFAFPQEVSFSSTQEAIAPLPHGPPLPADLPIYLRVRSLRI